MSVLWWEPKSKEFQTYSKEILSNPKLPDDESKSKALADEVRSMFSAYEKKWVSFCLFFGLICFFCGLVVYKTYIK